jgi:hypothetical protein
MTTEFGPKFPLKKGDIVHVNHLDVDGNPTETSEDLIVAGDPVTTTDNGVRVTSITVRSVDENETQSPQ